MHIRRILAGTAAALSTACIGVVVSSPASAGGAPPYPMGTVTVDRTVIVDAGTSTVSGSYRCLGGGERIGAIDGDIYQWKVARSLGSFRVDGLQCDGRAHAWTAVVENERRAHPGRGTAFGSLEVCESVGGDCPRAQFDERIQLVRAH
ncbi:hypothetical protein DFJ68_0030 [Terracoccus luteus]|jgi:hypothetical protein|uniref:DUF6299 domain-containing protein n=1 Tax=Terracoccus luteus TaxID=53356 RepID=A0A495XUM9_9MICO|nr:DUF6299 family protein [Terracoccus luteus]RKT76634.1 hypothetical protein DFJ68_0030 [Terracoccus luteus]